MAEQQSMIVKEAPFGTWTSPIDATAVAGASLKLGEPRLAGNVVYWLERRPREGGRSVLVAQEDGMARDLTPAPMDVRSQVHEYGGGSYAVSANALWLVNRADGCLYRRRGEEWERMCSPGQGEFADLAVDASRERVICVRERAAGDDEPQAEIVAVGPAMGQIEVLVAGEDFYASPRISPDGRELCFLSWRHPDMPWDATVLWRATFGRDGRLAQTRRLAGDASLFQPQWSPDGALYVVSDHSNWWNLHRVDESGLQPVAPAEAEFGLPQWVFGQSTYAFADRDTLVAARARAGIWELVRVDLPSARVTPFALPYTDIGDVQAGHGEIVFSAGDAGQATGIFRLRARESVPQAVRSAGQLDAEPAWISRPRSLQFPTTQNDRAYALFYPPHSPEHRAPAGEAPPLLVKCHGGPTGATGTTLDPRIQYWTTRGIGVLDVNYRGSTGYGRDYRRRLYGHWGDFDVADCVAGARFLAESGDADPDRLLISGSSAGGYTVLCALTFHDVFAAGASYYGIGDLESLVATTHKFESRYTDRLIGPYPAMQTLYRERSPLHSPQRLRCPVIFFQGLRDKVVPPQQAERMVAALDAKRVPVAYVSFAEEQHGFRDAANIRRAIEAELYFYGRVLGFTPAGRLTPVAIKHLEPTRGGV